MNEQLTPREFDVYFALLRRMLRLSQSQTEEVASELRDHLSLRLEELVERGVDRDDAIQQALEEFGDVAVLATQFVSLRNQRKRRWMMKAGIRSIAVCFAALVLAAMLWPDDKGTLAPAPTVAQVKTEQPATAVDQDKAASDEQTRNAATEKKLKETTSVAFKETPLKEAVTAIAAGAGVQFLIDARSLDDIGIKTDTPVTLQLIDVPASFVLELILRDLGLDYCIRHGVVMVATQEELKNFLDVRVYDIRDLINQEPVAAVDPEPAPAKVPAEKPAPVAYGVGGGGFGDGFLGAEPPDDLVGLITLTVTPTEWDAVGGASSISIYRGALVISTTAEGHHKVQKLLEELRRVLK